MCEGVCWPAALPLLERAVPRSCCCAAVAGQDLTRCPSLMLSLFVSSTTGRPSNRLLPGSLCDVQHHAHTQGSAVAVPTAWALDAALLGCEC